MNAILDGFAQVLSNPLFYANVLMCTAPVLVAALGCAIAQKAGQTNMGMEGIMTLSSFVGVIASGYLAGPNPFVGLFVSIIVGGLLGLLVAIFNLKLKVDIVLVGIAMNLFCYGLACFCLPLVTPNHDRSSTNSLITGLLPTIEIPFIKDIPFIGPILSGHNILTYVSFILIAVMSFITFKTKLGLRIRAVGENPDAAESVGISSDRIKTIALIISGMLGGIAGYFMSAAYVSYFSKGAIGGRGFIGLAANSMGNSNPIPTALTSLLFGFFFALGNFGSTTGISSYLLKMMPYIATLIGVVIYSVMTVRKEKARLAGKSEEKTNDE